ncbi:MAG: tetratricopeptide repeat protein [Hormoscilla sp. GM7CHS1pb]|nr:tetratricopeptide repeat protein [Hormoscilla sp. GM7CHS1pb]
MWKKFWQWLQGLLRRLLGRSPQRKVPNKQQENVRPLLYQNYEFLFLRLLEGVAGGWQEQQVWQFLAEWENRTTEADWIAWLHSFGERTLSSKSPNVELGRQMVLLSQVGCGELGRVAGEFGEELLRRYPQIQAVSNTQDAAPPSMAETPPEPEDNPPEPVPETPPGIEAIAPNVTPVQKRQKSNAKIKSQAQPDSLDEVLAMLQNNSGMVKQLARQMGIQTTNPQVILRELEVRAWMQEALRYQQAGTFSRAIACCDRALALKADYQNGWAMRGDALFKLKRYELAVASYNKATELKPDDWEAWYNQAMALFKLSRHAEAVDSFQRSLKLKPDFAPAWKNLAIALFNLKLYSEAIASCEEALKIQPQDRVAVSCMQKYRAALRHQEGAVKSS